MAVLEWTKLALLSLAVGFGLPVKSHAADPPLPPGNDPGGTAIALISKGVDYTDPVIAKKLARDGEGQMIGWDFVDNDIAPYSTDAQATKLAKLLLATYGGARLVVVRIDPNNAAHLARAAAFVARTPARIAALPHASTSKHTWVPFLEVAKHTTNTLYIVSAGDRDTHSGVASWPGSAKLANSIIAAPFKGDDTTYDAASSAHIDAWVVPSGATLKTDGKVLGPPTTSAQAVAMIAAQAGCVTHQLNKDGSMPATAKDIRVALLSKKQPLPIAQNPRRLDIKVHDPLCWHTP